MTVNIPSDLENDVFNYLSITENEYPRAHQHFDQQRFDRDYFASLTDFFRSPHLWQFSNHKWKLRTSVCGLTSSAICKVNRQTRH